MTGIKKADGAILVKPKIQEIYGLGFNHGVLTCFINYKLTYINPKGEVIWQESEMGNRFQSLTDLNIDFINETNYRVFSANDSRKRIYRSFVSGCISETHRSFNSKSNSLNLEVHTEIKDTFTVDTFRLAKNGSAVYVTNTTNDSLEFYSQGTYLNMLVQALNQRGEWKNIEQLPTGNCIDNSRILTLAPNHFWKFATPKYEGDFKTKLRIAIKYIDPTDTTDDLRGIDKDMNGDTIKILSIFSIDKKRNEITIYSNEYEGSVNPSQFWRNRNNHDDGIMDASDE